MDFWHNIPPKAFTLSAVGIGYLIMGDEDPVEQNAIGNWLMLIAQMLCTNAYFLELQEQNSQEQRQMTNEEIVIMMQKIINAIKQEIEEIKSKM